MDRISRHSSAVISRIAALCLTGLFSGCGSGSGSSNGPYSPPTGLAISPRPTSIPVNGTVTFTSTVATGLNNPSWILTSYAYANLGSPNVQNGGTTYVYSAPPTPPLYTGAGEANTPGTVTLSVSDVNASTLLTFTITTPSITVVLSPSTIAVALGSTQQFTGYAIGNINNDLSVAVNGVVGGSAQTGTIAVTPESLYGTYTYTAPAIMPMTGNKVTITYTSQADSSKSASSVVTLH